MATPPVTKATQRNPQAKDGKGQQATNSEMKNGGEPRTTGDRNNPQTVERRPQGKPQDARDRHVGCEAEAIPPDNTTQRGTAGCSANPSEEPRSPRDSTPGTAVDARSAKQRQDQNELEPRKAVGVSTTVSGRPAESVQPVAPNQRKIPGRPGCLNSRTSRRRRISQASARIKRSPTQNTGSPINKSPRMTSGVSRGRRSRRTNRSHKTRIRARATPQSLSPANRLRPRAPRITSRNRTLSPRVRVRVRAKGNPIRNGPTQRHLNLRLHNSKGRLDRQVRDRKSPARKKLAARNRAQRTEKLGKKAQVRVARKGNPARLPTDRNRARRAWWIAIRCRNRAGRILAPAPPATVRANQGVPPGSRPRKDRPIRKPVARKAAARATAECRMVEDRATMEEASRTAAHRAARHRPRMTRRTRTPCRRAGKPGGRHGRARGPASERPLPAKTPRRPPGRREGQGPRKRHRPLARTARTVRRTSTRRSSRRRPGPGRDINVESLKSKRPHSPRPTCPGSIPRPSFPSKNRRSCRYRSAGPGPRQHRRHSLRASRRMRGKWEGYKNKLTKVAAPKRSRAPARRAGRSGESRDQRAGPENPSKVPRYVRV